MDGEEDMWAPRKRDADGKLAPRPAPKNVFVHALMTCMTGGETALGLTDKQWGDGIAAWHKATLPALMDAAPEAPEEEWVYREEVIKALCACQHTKGHYLRAQLIGARDLHKAWRTKAWNTNQFCRVSLLMTAYREQLPGEFAPTAPIPDPYNHGFFHGQSIGAHRYPHLANDGDEYLTWRGDYRPFAYHREAAA